MLAITSRNNAQPTGNYTNSQLRYALIYVLITFAVLLFLNIYTFKLNQQGFYNSKESAMMEKCQLAATEIGDLEVINGTTVSSSIAQMGSLKVTRIMVTDHTGLVIYDSTNQAVGSYALLPEIVRAMEGCDVSSWYYHDGAMQTNAAVPVMSYGTPLACVYMMEYDQSQGALMDSLQRNIFTITLILEIVVIVGLQYTGHKEVAASAADRIRFPFFRAVGFFYV